MSPLHYSRTTIIPALAGLATLLSLALGDAGAQTIAGAAGSASDNQPIQINADSGIEWQQNARVYIARGNAVASRGSAEVRADTLTAHYRDAKGASSGGNTEIYRIEADGHVLLKRDAQTVAGDRAVYDVDQAIAVITGKDLKLTTATDVVTARDSLEWYDQKQVAVARGNAVASRQGKTIKADILTAYMQKTQPPPGKPGAPAARPAPVRDKPPLTQASAGGSAPGGGKPGAPGGESKISRVDAQGNVVVTNSVDTGKGDFGVYNGDTGIATLIGNVVLQRGNNVIRGQRGVMDMNNNVSRMLPGAAPGDARQRVQGLFIRDEAKAPAGSPGKRPAADAAAGGDKKP